LTTGGEYRAGATRPDDVQTGAHGVWKADAHKIINGAVAAIVTRPRRATKWR
jgi:hypothetical protein